MVIFVFLIFQYLFGVQYSFSQERYITICSFDISALGSSSQYKNHSAIARILGGFDLIAVQDVQDNGGAAHIAAIVDSLNQASMAKYQYFILPKAGRGFPGYEGYAYIYRSPVELDTSFETPYGFKDTTVEYGRVPGWAAFRAGNFDFILASIHLHWSNLDTRAAETADILNWLMEYHQRSKVGERDLIIAGVTQRYGNYTVAQYNARATAYHILLDNAGYGNIYRLPFCEFLPTPDMREAPDDSGSTTVTESNDMIYDEIIISSGVFNEFGAACAVLGGSIGIVDFDNGAEYAGLDSGDIAELVSDHRPVYARFRIDMDDDDGPGNSVTIVPVQKEVRAVNYPNPFNGSTSIKFNMERAGVVKAGIYNICGQKIASYEKNVAVPGDVSFLWNPGNISGGVYIYRIETDGGIFQGKMLFLK